MKYLYLLSILILGISCQQKNDSEFEGLWLIEKVSVGDQIMTPISKWSRFNADFTFESGNGWYQHSIGKWKLNEGQNELELINENFIKDSYGPFTIEIAKDDMKWKRIEDGEAVTVSLKKTDKIPQSIRDEILGVWELERSTGIESQFLNKADSINLEKYLFLKWDHKFVIGLNKGRKSGVYNIHGHKAEIELIPYGDYKREFWNFEIENDVLEMKLLNSNIETTRVYKRVDEFPK